jgi:PAS domain S-box-containing protein
MALPDLAGTTVGRYRVGSRIGAGGASAVYRAVDVAGERQVALKFLDPELTGRPGFLPRCVEEIATISRLDHRAIVPVHEVATRGPLTYVSMRLVRGGTLRDVLGRRPLDVRSALGILQQVAGALHSAHEAGVVHQDLKPSNVLVESDGSVLVADFGMAPARYGYATSAPWYLSPEQVPGAEPDRRTDVHALGLLLYEMVTGTSPGESVRSSATELSSQADRVLFRALDPDPMRRQATVVQFLGELDDVFSARPRRAWAPDQLPALIEASPDAVVAVDAGGRVTHWNSHARELFGWQQEQVAGGSILATLIAPRHRELVEGVLAALTAGQAARPGKDGHVLRVTAMHRDGREIPLEMSLSPVTHPASAASVVAFCREAPQADEAERARAAEPQPTAASGRRRYRVDTLGSQLAFSCAFMKFMTVHGRFRDFSGWVEVDGQDLTTARAECRIRTASVDTGSLDRDYHLSSPDFFAVERFPEMVFRSTAVQPLGDERFRMFGELTIRSVTRPIRLEVRLEDWEVDASGVERATLTALTVIRRLDWFLDWERALRAGRWIVGDEVKLDLVIIVVRRPEASAGPLAWLPSASR